MSPRVHVLTIGLVLLVPVLVAADPPPLGNPGDTRIIELPYPIENAAMGISSDGATAIGWTRAGNNMWATRWTRAGSEALGDLPGGDVFAQARAVSHDGSTIVGVSDAGFGLQAFIWTQEMGMQIITDAHMPLFCSAAYGVSADGKIVVGQAYNCGCGNEGRAFRWSLDGGFEFLGMSDGPGGALIPLKATGISADGKVIVGLAQTKNGYEAFVWDEINGAVPLGDLPGGAFYSTASAVSADGNVIVGQSWGENGLEAFRYTKSEGMAPLGDIPDGGFNSNALAVCGDGSVIVGVGEGWAGEEAFIWDATNGMRSLELILGASTGGDYSAWRILAATGVCAKGRNITGYGLNPSGQMDMWKVNLRNLDKGSSGQETHPRAITGSGKR